MQIGFKAVIVSYDRAPRFADSSKYPLRKMIALALDGVTAFSSMPLRFIMLVGFVVSFISFLKGAWALLAAFFSLVVPGWALSRFI
jgi:hypothetical protein